MFFIIVEPNISNVCKTHLKTARYVGEELYEIRYLEPKLLRYVNKIKALPLCTITMSQFKELYSVTEFPVVHKYS